jgi:hypothetical protein
MPRRTGSSDGVDHEVVTVHWVGQASYFKTESPRLGEKMEESMGGNGKGKWEEDICVYKMSRGYDRGEKSLPRMNPGETEDSTRPRKKRRATALE